MVNPLTQLIACPRCRARVDQRCRTSTGRPRKPHGCRLTPVLCSCGSALAPGHAQCARCVREHHREADRIGIARRRAARREEEPGVVQGR